MSRVSIYDVATGRLLSNFQGKSAYRARNGETIIGVEADTSDSWDATTTVVLAADGSRRTVVGQHSSVSPPVLSPDGTLVAMTFNVSTRAGGGQGTIVYRIDGKPELHRSQGDNAPHVAFYRNCVPQDWTPDGRLVVTAEVPYAAKAYLEEGNEKWFCISTARFDDLLIINRQLSGDEPSVSPDGRQLAYVHGDNVWIANIDGSQPRRVTEHGYLENPRGPAWSPDGKTLLVQGDVGVADGGQGHTETYLYLVSADAEQEKLVTKLLDAKGNPILAGRYRPSWR